MDTSIQVKNQVAAGMFHYADDSVSFERLVTKEVKAVVAYVDAHGFYSICIDQEKLPWSSGKLKLLICSELPGINATKLVVDNARALERSAEAATYCFEYHKNGVLAGQAFLPSIGEICRFFTNEKAINQGLKLLDAAPLDSMLSVTVPYKDCVCCGSSYGVRYAEPTTPYFVRPVLYTKFK